MSSIEKLLIRGIRSFDPDSASVIEFYSPVTLIVGHNGAGKTSIIECLKYATTGDLPPNAKGGAFVHDPKLCGESEVKGQVKLKFRNVRGQSLVVTRSLQSTLKRGGKLEQKTLESLLVTTDPITNEQVSISSRVAEMDAEIPVQLGVSKAVLEDVIFCHQEESQWPLSEPAALKKRFDDLFAATRYTRALEALKSSRKDLLSELRLEQQKLDFLTNDREKAIKVQTSINLNEKAMVECKKKIEQCNGNIEITVANIAKLQEELTELSSAFNELERLTNEVRMLETTVVELEVEVGKELELSDGDIQAELARFNRLVDDHQGEVDRLEYRKGELVANLSTKQQFINSLLAEKGTVIALQEELSRKRSSLQNLVDSLCELFGIECAFDENTLGTIQKYLASQERELVNAKNQYEDLSKSTSAALSDIQSKSNLRDEMRRMKKQSLDGLHQSLLSTIEQLEDLESSESQVEDLKQRLIDSELNCNRADQILEVGDFDRRQSELLNEKRAVEEEIKQCNRQIAEQSEHAESRAKYEIKLSEQRRKQETIDKLLSDCKSDLNLFNINQESSQLDRDVDQLLKSKEKELKAAQESLDKAISVSSLLSSKRDHLAQQITERETTLSQKKQQVKGVIGDENLDMLLDDCEAEYKKLIEDSAEYNSMGRYAEKMKQSHSCPVCDRAFADVVEERCVLQRVENKSRSTADLKASIVKVEARLASLRRVKPVCEEIDRITLFEMTELHKNLDETSDDFERKEIDLQDLKSSHSKLQLDEKRLQMMKRKVDELVKVQRELRNIKEDISFLERTVDSKSVSISQLRGKLQTLEDKLRTINSEYESMAAEHKQKSQDAQNHASRFRDLKEELMRLQLRQSEKGMLEKAKKDCESSISGLEAELAAISDELVRLADELKSKTQLFNLQLEQASSNYKTIEAAYEKRRQLFTSFASQFAELQALGDPTTRLSMVEHQLSDAHNDTTNIQSEIDSVADQLQSIRQGASDIVNRERKLKENLKLRDLRRKLQGKRQDCTALEAKLSGVNKTVRTSDLTKMQLSLSDMMGDRSGVSGELRQLEDQSSRLSKELMNDYPNIEEKFREQTVKVKASEMAADDLDRYAKALDQAIIRYHAAKMDEVNRTVRELWSTVYTGSDIDAVEIRADQEGSTAGHRSYNYRVVMIKGQVELDMRGRSSAGQRVLTSLLIRLALADTFASHCGVLALDEPTTNLDRDNIAALAEALADLIRARREQSNFQLIVITHDEEFVEALARHECAEYYWRISKNSKQCSVIERQSLSSF